MASAALGMIIDMGSQATVELDRSGDRPAGVDVADVRARHDSEGPTAAVSTWPVVGTGWLRALLSVWRGDDRRPFGEPKSGRTNRSGGQGREPLPTTFARWLG